MMTGLPTVYFSPRACSLAVIAALEQASLTYEAVAVPMTPDGAGGDTYLRINPRRQVPVLLLDGRAIREIPAIFTALDDRVPGAALLPRGDRLAALEWLGFLASSVHPLFRPVFRPRRYVGDDAAAQAVLRRATLQTLAVMMAQVERDLAGRDWLLGTFSAVDFYLFVLCRWMILLELPLGSRLAAHHARTGDAHAMKRALAREAAATPAAA